MSYLKRWRHYTAEVQALAASGSNEESSHEEINSGNSSGSGLPANDGNHPIPVMQDVSTDESVSSTDDNDESSENGDEQEDTFDLCADLAAWAAKNKCTRSGVNEIMDILRRQGHRLPKDARTLMNTPRLVQSEEKCGGLYKYFGIESGLLNMFAQNPNYNVTSEITLMFSIDGVPLYKSNNLQLWPILCGVDDFEPFIASVFYGQSKPNSVTKYLSYFLLELNGLCGNGLNVNDQVIEVKVKAFVCDAPARSFLKCIKGHTAYYSCERCVIKGEWNGHVVYNIPEEDDALPDLRTDERFAGNLYPEHQVACSPLTVANISCVKSFPLDYMHLVCLGVVKRMLMFLNQGPREVRLSQQQVGLLSEKLVHLNGKMPRKFACQPRSLSEIDRWKATEFRQFLLYTGQVILHSVVTKELYNHFLTLTVAISILLSSNDDIRNYYLEYSSELLKYFVRKAKHIYGDTFVSYNVHAMIHIADDAKNFGSSLNEFSAFQFENHLQKLKKSVRNAKKPIAQIAKRTAELENISKRGFVKLRFPFISSTQKDSCFLTKNGKYAFVHEKRKRTLVCDVYSQQDTDNFFASPLDSKVLDVCVLKNGKRPKRQLLERSDLERKVVCLPDEGRLVLLPMLHEMERLKQRA